MFTSIDKCLIYLSTYSIFLHAAPVMGFPFTTWDKHRGLECARLCILGLRRYYTRINESKNGWNTIENLFLLSNIFLMVFSSSGCKCIHILYFFCLTYQMKAHECPCEYQEVIKEVSQVDLLGYSVMFESSRLRLKQIDRPRCVIMSVFTTILKEKSAVEVN